ncbi:U3 small nucleolar RNA-associated protein 4, putative (UTP4) [Balamuthia mandrillaris]
MSLTAKLASLSLSGTDPAEAIGHLKKQTLFEIFASDKKLPPLPETATRKTALTQLAGVINQTAARYLVEGLQKDELKAALKSVAIDHGENNENSKTVLRKRLYEVFMDHGIEAFMAEYCDTAVLKSFAESLDLEVTSKKAELQASIAKALNHAALLAFFDSLSTNTLHELCFAQGLETATPVTSSRAALVQALLRNEKVQKPKKKKQQPIQFSKKKKAIAKGITFQDIFQHYSKEEVVEYCKENNLVQSGKKKEVINRILAFLDGDKENAGIKTERVAKKKSTTAAKKKTATTKKASASGSRASARLNGEEPEVVPARVAKKKTTSTTTTTTKKTTAAAPATKKTTSASATKKTIAPKKTNTKRQQKVVEPEPEPEPEQVEEEEDQEEEMEQEEVAEETSPVAEEEEEAEEEAEEEVEEEDGEEEDDDEIDLDHLDSYDLEKLKSYCEEEQIPVKGTTKAAYIQAILDYNAAEEEEEEEEEEDEEEQ